MLTTEPSNWSTNYTDYYTLNEAGTALVAVTGVTAPTFVSGKYYKYWADGYTVLATEPVDWDTDWTNYYVYDATTISLVHLAGSSAPAFVANTYWAAD